MFFTACFAINIAHTQKRSSTLKEFFLSLFHKNTVLRSPFNIKPYICFYIKTISVILLDTKIRLRNISRFVTNAIHSSMHASNAHSFNNL